MFFYIVWDLFCGLYTSCFRCQRRCKWLTIDTWKQPSHSHDLKWSEAGAGQLGKKGATFHGSVFKRTDLKVGFHQLFPVSFARFSGTWRKHCRGDGPAWGHTWRPTWWRKKSPANLAGLSIIFRTVRSFILFFLGLQYSNSTSGPVEQSGLWGRLF